MSAASKVGGGIAIFTIVTAISFVRLTHSPSPVKTETAAHPPASATHPVRQVVQLPDCATPCTIKIGTIQDLYTDGEPVYVLPPRWPEKDKIFYPGKGHLILEGGNIHEGWWKFWSPDPAKIVMIRTFERR